MAEPHIPSDHAPQSSSSSGTTNANEAVEFECNICFDLAQDPVITLCGHLYCWPCLYKWLRAHSRAQECPVCKALIEEEKVIPLYGRGKTPTDPRSKPVPGVEIPVRPAGQRPETMPPLENNNFANMLFRLMGGFAPITSASFNSFGMYAGFGGMFSPFFSVQFGGFSDAGGHGAPSGYHHGFSNNSLGREASRDARADDENLKKILFMIIFFVIIALLLI
ncbi:RING/U-box superfamily protein [Striga hermonthica]|uniref:E3 ubiquitin-protein ligase RMA n=1 Tax=Striga hermonthica TaxID=68872 RepID=A0A9N7RRD3_STRHE|nr:RING/U-box superfamily protein [Striga hermonthica]